MSFGANQARLMLLIAMQFDMELQMNLIQQHRLYLSKQSAGFMNMKIEYEPGSMEDKVVNARIHQLNEAEKVLDIRIKSLESRLKAITTERDGLTKMIGENIQRSFKNSYG